MRDGREFRQPDRVGDLPSGDPGGCRRAKPFLGHVLNGERRMFAYIATLLPNRVDAEAMLQGAGKILMETLDDATSPRRVS
jgi:hypothetical protein